MPRLPRSPPNGACPRAVEVLVFPGVQMLDATGPSQVFATANEVVAGGGRDAPYALRIVARDGTVRASRGSG